MKRYKVKPVVIIATLLVVTLFFFIQPYRLYIVIGESMRPTYHPNQLLWTTQHIDKIATNDIIAFDFKNEILIKRVTYVAGESLWVTDDGLTLDILKPSSMKTVEEQVKQLKLYGFNVYEIVIPEGYIFVEGDNVSNSVDSRSFGAIPISYARAKVL